MDEDFHGREGRMAVSTNTHAYPMSEARATELGIVQELKLKKGQE